MLLNLLQEAPLTFAILAVVLLYSLVLHELAHALLADLFGDKTARNLGRLSLNPLRHLDPVGTLLLLLAGFGWAKPVPIRPGLFKNYRAGMFFVSIAGVLVNFALAVLALATLGGLGVRVADTGLTTLPGSEAQALARDEVGTHLLSGLFIAARINLILVVFNLLPIPPLDGSKVVQALAPASWQRTLWQAERYGFLLVIGLLVLFREPTLALIDGATAGLMRLLL